MIAIRPLIISLVKKILLVFFIYALCRVLFYAFNHSSFYDLTFSHLSSLLYYGLRFDAFSICATNSLFILLAILPFKFQLNRGYQKNLFFIFVVTNGIAIASNFVDFAYFPYTQKRTTYDVTHLVFGGQTEITKLLPHFFAESWYLVIIYLLFMIGLIKGFNFIQKKTYLQHVPYTFKNGVITLTIFLLSAGFTVLGIRGGLQKIPIVLMDAALYTSQKYTPIVINTPFSFIKSAELNQLEPIHFFDETVSKKISSQIIPADTGKFNNLNVCVIILESFSKEFTKSGNRISYTPFLDSLMSVSTNFTNAFANGKTSINGIPSIVSSLPTFMDDPYLNSSYANNKIETLASLLKKKGYETSFFHGATNGSMNFNSYAKSANYDLYFGRTEFNNETEYDGQWGIWDEPFLLAMNNELTKMKQPFFTTVFTLSSHNPYKVPQKYAGKFPKGTLEIHESIGYTDYSLRQFFNEAKKANWYNNTLFVITADHTAVSDDVFYNNSVGQHAIPLIIFKPNQTPELNKKIMQQINIMPTILDLLNYDEPYYAFGNSYYNVTTNPAVFYTGPNYHLLNDSMYYVFNNFIVTELYNYKRDSSLTKNLKGNYIKEENETLDYLIAYIQNYNNDILNNKTYYTKQN